MGSPVRLSLIRKHTWLGGERNVVGLTVLVSVLFGWLLTNAYGVYYGVPVAVLIWVPGVWVGREMHKADPYAWDVWERHLRYDKFYAPRVHYASQVPKVRDFV